MCTFVFYCWCIHVICLFLCGHVCSFFKIHLWAIKMGQQTKVFAASPESFQCLPACPPPTPCINAAPSRVISRPQILFKSVQIQSDHPSGSTSCRRGGSHYHSPAERDVTRLLLCSACLPLTERTILGHDFIFCAWDMVGTLFSLKCIKRKKMLYEGIVSL